MTHELKTWPEYFQKVVTDEKKFEIRRDDRGFQVGDVLRLLEYVPAENRFTGCSLVRRVTYITNYEQKPGFVVMALSPASYPT